ncbi:exosome component 3-5 exonuclease [Diplodia corticola]|uniref:Exosome component 3-5 exonuclease n=1 Tax=Diplodia corticola TaxID=236234 RepID=A0A1J9S643_9PEZI|nr:exosome component 3-5 exonuclease [Diplodia corticola]OJD35991.1 exosome component 3-5 exonuclease [Diplodia corticola]
MDDFQDFQKSVQSALVQTTRSTTALCAEDLGFHRSLEPKLGAALDKQNARLLSLAERLLGSAAAGSEVVGPKLDDQDAVDSGWRGVVDVVDSLLERADTSLDEFTGIVKRLTPSKEQSPAPAPKSRGGKNFRNQDLPKPQALFEHVPTNDATSPWKPLITSKPHATVPFERSFNTYTDEYGAEHFQHPYRKEIEDYQYPSSVYTKADPIPYQPFETTTATFVDTPEALDEMLAELKNAKEIAIDLEHHDTRTYIGIVSLMQISTRNKDWIVDTLKPWRRNLQCLNEVFTDPNIVKVLHGAYMDAIWLQRDLGLYLVGLFDTHHAARALGYAGGSLAFLLQKFVNFNAQKQYQMADWRMRPLPQELFDYARSDTHFLLYIYDNMRNELVDESQFDNPEQDRILRVLSKSKETSLQTYENPIYDAKHGSGPAGWYKALWRNPNAFNKEQFAVFRAVHQWRDAVARQEDESTHYVMANHALFSVARAVPADKAALFTVAQPVSPVVRLRADELVGTIARAKEAGAEGPEMWEVFAKEKTALPTAQTTATTTAAALVSTQQQPLSFAAPATKPVVSDAALVRADRSSFWGKAFASSLWQNAQQHNNNNGDFVSPAPAPAPASIRLAVPLPPLTAEIFADPADATAAKAAQSQNSNPASRAEHAFVKAEDRPAKKEGDDGVIVIKQLGGGGRKRKLADLAAEAEEAEVDAEAGGSGDGDGDGDGDDDMQMQDDVVALPLSPREEKRAAKAAKKEAKKAARQEEKKMKKRERKERKSNNDAEGDRDGEGEGEGDGEGEGEGEGDEDGDGEPFDYDAAPSVLHAPKQDRKDRKKGKNKKKEFNPYARAADAPKGLGRVQKERAGRTATFKD